MHSSSEEESSGMRVTPASLEERREGCTKQSPSQETPEDDEEQPEGEEEFFSND